MVFAPRLSHAQNDPLQRRISVQATGITLTEAFERIGEAANCTFSYSNTLLDLDRRVNLQFTNATVSDILVQLLGDGIKAARTKGNQILIQASQGKSTVAGTVQTSDGKPAPYVTVGIQGYRSTRTDEQGHF